MPIGAWATTRSQRELQCHFESLATNREHGFVNASAVLQEPSAPRADEHAMLGYFAIPPAWFFLRAMPSQFETSCAI